MRSWAGFWNRSNSCSEGLHTDKAEQGDSRDNRSSGEFALMEPMRANAADALDTSEDSDGAARWD